MEYFALFCEAFFFCQRWSSNRGLLAPKSNVLTTRLCTRREQVLLSWVFQTLLQLFLKNGLRGFWWPQCWTQRPQKSSVLMLLRPLYCWKSYLLLERRQNGLVHLRRSTSPQIKLTSPACCMQANAMFPPHIHRTWEPGKAILAHPCRALVC